MVAKSVPRRRGPLQQLRWWVRRNQVLVFILALATAMLLSGVTVFFFLRSLRPAAAPGRGASPEAAATWAGEEEGDY